MINFVLGILVFLAGAVVGVVVMFKGMIGYAREMEKELTQDHEEMLKEVNDEIAKLTQELDIATQPKIQLVDVLPPLNPADTVQARLRKAIEITLKQNKLNIKTNDEQMLLHNELELEKFNLLRTILLDGFNPMITIRYSSGEQEMLLSSYIENMQKNLN